MAYSKPCTCKDRQCKKSPTMTVYDRYGMPLGNFCTVHGRREVEIQRRVERTQDQYSTINAGTNPDEFQVTLRS